MQDGPLPRFPARTVLIHGLCSSPLWMGVLGRRLRRLGLAPQAWTYPSVRGDLKRVAMQFRQFLSDRPPGEGPVHVVAHSMGCVITRLALAAGPLPGVGRVVLIAPPNRGAPLARLTAPLARWFCPALDDLSDHPASTVNRLPGVRHPPVGVLAARFDLLVPLRCTPLDGQSDYLALNGTHNSLLFSAITARHVAAFLASGRFACRGVVATAAG